MTLADATVIPHLEQITSNIRLSCSASDIKSIRFILIIKRAYGKVQKFWKVEIPILICLAHSPEEYRQLGWKNRPLPKLFGGYITWNGRVVLPSLKLFLEQGGNYARYERLLTHEIFHMFHKKILGIEKLDSLPVWFVEGLATWASKTKPKNTVSGKLLELTTSADWHQNGSPYYEARGFIDFLVKKTGVAALRELASSAHDVAQFKRLASKLIDKNLQDEYDEFKIKFVRKRPDS
jgi:hypothetical protein